MTVCVSGKIRYGSARDANQARRKQNRAAVKGFSRWGLIARAYLCPDCKGWHLTKRPGGQR